MSKQEESINRAGAISRRFITCTQSTGRVGKSTVAEGLIPLRHAYSDATFVTNIFTGRPARTISNRLALEIGPILDALPEFPLPIGALAPLRAKAEQ